MINFVTPQFENLSTSSRYLFGSQLRWFGHVSRMPQKWLSKQTLNAKVNGKRPVGRPRTRWLGCIKDLGWNRFGLCLSKMQSVLLKREAWWFNLEQLLPAALKKKRMKKKEEEDIKRVGQVNPRKMQTKFYKNLNKRLAM